MSEESAANKFMINNSILKKHYQHNSLTILSSRVFCCCVERFGKKSIPVTPSMSLMGVRENLNNLDVGDGSCVILLYA